jgi:hypothetical protein
LIQFDSSQYVSASVVPQNLFELETKSLIDRFRSSLTNNFLLSLAVIRDVTQANALFSALETNYNPFLANVKYPIMFNPSVYNDCSCTSSSTCHALSGIFNLNNRIKLFNVSGFHIGCYITESLLRSTLECFYDQQCVNKLQGYIQSSSPMDVTALDVSLLSEYSMNSTIKELVENLMIEQWNFSSNFESYYNECQPVRCTYTFETNNDVIYIATTLFGIAGGLVTVLKFIVPRLIKLVRKKKQQRQPITGKIK